MSRTKKVVDLNSNQDQDQNSEAAEYPEILLSTDYPVASESLDHLHPLGALGNNESTPFVQRLLSLRQVDAYLDLGCAGGGLVVQMANAGVPISVGLEGSPVAATSERSSWGNAPANATLFTCDITKPFELTDGEGNVIQFTVITAWEVLEHIKEEDLAGIFNNINRHTSTRLDAWCIFSVSTDESWSEGVDLHVTKRDREWWLDTFEKNGWKETTDIQNAFHRNEENHTLSEWMCNGPNTLQFALEKIND